jgi:hypothetical protein
MFVASVPSSSPNAAKKLGISKSPNIAVEIMKVCLLKFFIVILIFVSFFTLAGNGLQLQEVGDF